MRRDRAPQASYLQRHKGGNGATNIALTKKVDKSASKPTANGDGGKIARYINWDDIPDGLPLSPSQQKQSITFSRQNAHQYVQEEEDDDEEELEYIPQNCSTAATKPPPLPHEEQYASRSSAVKDYPTLARVDSGRKSSIPMVYPKTSPSKVSATHQPDLDWGEEDDAEDDNGVEGYDKYDDFGDSPRSRQMPSASNSRGHQDMDTGSYDSRPAKQKATQSKPSAVAAEKLHARPGKLDRGDKQQQQPSVTSHVASAVRNSAAGGALPKLPFEAAASHRASDPMEDKELSEKDQLYFSKQPRAVEYKPYTLGQYKQIKPKEYVEIEPHLKPDLTNDALLAKRANAERVKEFSKQLKEFNRSSLQEQRKLPYSSEAVGIEISKKKLESNRERALQFSKHIPKPKAKSTADVDVIVGTRKNTGRYGDDDDEDEDDRYDDSYVRATDKYGQTYESATRMQELQAKHNDNRRNIAAIKKSMGL